MMNKKVLERAIIVSWIILIIALIVKIAGGNWFNVVFTGERMLRADAFFERHNWLQIIVFSITAYVGSVLYYLAICRKRNFKWYIHTALTPYFIIVTIIKVLLYDADVRWGLLLDVITLFIIPFILLGKPRREYMRVIIAFVLLTGFQSISLLARDITIDVVVAESALTELILTIDVFIMFTLYYLHSQYHKKEVKSDEQTTISLIERN